MARKHPLAEGTYALTHDIENPKPGRRSRLDWRTEPEFKKGRLFIVDHKNYGRDADDTVLAIRAQSGSDEVTAHSRTDLFGLLIAHLEPAIETPSDLLARERLDNRAGALLDRLCKEGVITMDQVQKALAAELAEDEADAS